MYEIERQLRFEDFVFAYGTLDKNNCWVKMADILDWDKIEVVYAKKFVKNGSRAKNARMALGSLLRAR